MRTSAETRTWPGPTAPLSPDPSSDSWVQSLACHEQSQTRPADTWPIMASKDCVPLVRSRFPLGNKGAACRGSGQREAGALSGGGKERGREGLVGAEEMRPPPPLPPQIISPVCRCGHSVGTLRALSWPESKNWPPPALQSHLAWKAGSSWAGTRPSLRRKVIWSLALGRKVLTHSGHGLPQPQLSRYLLEDRGFLGMPFQETSLCS